MNRATRASLTLAVLAVVALVSSGAATTASASATPPTVEREWVTGVTEHNAVLHAEINPNGSLTKYKLQFDESGTFHFYQADCGVLHVPGYAYCMHVTPGDERIEPPEGSIPAGNSPVEVSVDLASIGATIEPNKTYYYRAIAANGAPEVEGPTQTFTTESPPPGPPTIENESVSHLTATEATLEAQINLHEASAGAYYQFQLVSDSSEYASEILCPPTLQPGIDGCIGPQGIALPIGFIPGNTMEPSSSARASAGVTLKPGTTYHYRVLVARRVQTEDTFEWEPPTVFGADQTFKTPSSLPPSIESESVSNVTPTDATLEAKINTEGLETTYEFHLLERWWCEELHPACYPPIRFLALPSGKLLGSFVGQSVSLDLNSAGVSLSPAHNFYEYWVTATNAAGTTEGQSQPFITPSEPGAEPLTESSGSSAPQSSTTTQSPSSASSSHHKKHRHRNHRAKLHRASRAG